ncbi:MAG TPA: helix-turn-helix domain-containing protein [Steroidobacteraceae bacterium]|nr:helix-turn-helix domain-containing protein [Steroidobacteraceae bacterium]
MNEKASFRPLARLGANVRIARKRRGLRIADLAQAAGCSQDTLRRLENADPGVSLGVLARVLEAIGWEQELSSMMDPAKDSLGLEAEVQRLPVRVRRPLLAVEKMSPERFWAEKGERQAVSRRRVASGEIAREALFAFSAEQLRGAQFSWPKGAFSALENDDDVEERSASAVQR